MREVKEGAERDEAQGNNARAGNPTELPRAVECATTRLTAVESPRGDAGSVCGARAFPCVCEGHGSREFAGVASRGPVRRGEAELRGGQVTGEGRAGSGTHGGSGEETSRVWHEGLKARGGIPEPGRPGVVTTLSGPYCICTGGDRRCWLRAAQDLRRGAPRARDWQRECQRAKERGSGLWSSGACTSGEAEAGSATVDDVCVQVLSPSQPGVSRRLPRALLSMPYMVSY